MGWIPAEVRQWNCVIRLWCRLKTMDVNRLNYKVYKWADSMKTRTKNWYFRFSETFTVYYGRSRTDSLKASPFVRTNAHR